MTAKSERRYRVYVRDALVDADGVDQWRLRSWLHRETDSLDDARMVCGIVCGGNELNNRPFLWHAVVPDARPGWAMHRWMWIEDAEQVKCSE